MKSPFFSNLASSTPFVFLSGLASILSLIISAINDNFFSWAILFITLTILFFLLRLIYLNSKFINEMDNVNLHIIDSSVELHADENGDYKGNADVIIAIDANMTPQTLTGQPQGKLKVNFPYQLDLIVHRPNTLIRETETNDSCTLSFNLSQGITFFALRSLSISSDKEADFHRTGKCIDIIFSCDINATTKEKTIHISTVG